MDNSLFLGIPIFKHIAVCVSQLLSLYSCLQCIDVTRFDSVFYADIHVEYESLLRISRAIRKSVSSKIA